MTLMGSPAAHQAGPAADSLDWLGMSCLPCVCRQAAAMGLQVNFAKMSSVAGICVTGWHFEVP